LDIMAECIAEPRSELAPWAPRIESFKVPIDKIGEIIGPGGKMIKSIIEECQVQIDIQDDGTVRILSPDKESINKAKSIIKGIAVDPVAGDMFEGQVTRIEPYGIFVKILGGTKEGMVHISEMYTGRINHPLDMVKLGDKVQVRTLGMDKGKLSLSMKGVAGNPEPHPDAHREEQQNYHQQNRDDRNRGRNSGRNDYHRHHR